MKTAATELLSRLDLAFCVDLTGSMTPFIAAARERLAAILTALGRDAELDLRVAFVGYRDYDPQGKAPKEPPLLERRDFAKAAQIDAHLATLQVKSPAANTDAAEAVLAGLLETIDALSWRSAALRVAVLVGDAPPHGVGTVHGPFPDRFAEDPTGASTMDVAARLEEAGITLHALGMVPSATPAYDPALREAFEYLARCTGGGYHDARDGTSALAVVEAISQRLTLEVSLARRLLAALA